MKSMERCREQLLNIFWAPIQFLTLASAFIASLKTFRRSYRAGPSLLIWLGWPWSFSESLDTSLVYIPCEAHRMCLDSCRPDLQDVNPISALASTWLSLSEGMDWWRNGRDIFQGPKLSFQRLMSRPKLRLQI